MRLSSLVLVCGFIAVGLPAQIARAQPQVRIPTTPQTIPQGSAIGGGLAPVPAVPGSSTIGAPTFDPYATAPNAASSPPTLPGAQPGFPATVPATPYNSAAPTPSWPNWTAPSAVPPGSSPVFPNTGYPGAYGQQPGVMFPNGMGVVPSWAPPNWQFPQPQEGRYLRLFQDLRFRYTWLAGGDGPRELGINEGEIAATMNFPNFFWSQRPLQVTPMFAVDWFDGPVTIAGVYPAGAAAVPPRVYGGSVGFGWQPQLTPQFSADLFASVGIFSDFSGITQDSLRFQGTGVGILALTPTLAVKLGVTYLDRVDLKLLPAAGVVWTPNPQTQWDIFFPRPKLSRYLTTVGNTDIWVYLNGEYGGGSWTIGEAAADRRMDVNDIRVGGGLEWTHQFGVHGFVEAAYVFNRELVFATGVPEQYDLDDTIMVRGGLVY